MLQEFLYEIIALIVILTLLTIFLYIKSQQPKKAPQEDSSNDSEIQEQKEQARKDKILARKKLTDDEKLKQKRLRKTKRKQKRKEKRLKKKRAKEQNKKMAMLRNDLNKPLRELLNMIKTEGNPTLEFLSLNLEMPVTTIWTCISELLAVGFDIRTSGRPQNSEFIYFGIKKK